MQRCTVSQVAKERNHEVLVNQSSRSPFPSCQLHSVSFVNHRGWTMHDLIKTLQEPEGVWRVHVLGGGAGPDPHRSRPW